MALFSLADVDNYIHLWGLFHPPPPPILTPSAHTGSMRGPAGLQAVVCSPPALLYAFGSWLLKLPSCNALSWGQSLFCVCIIRRGRDRGGGRRDVVVLRSSPTLPDAVKIEPGLRTCPYLMNLRKGKRYYPSPITSTHITSSSNTVCWKGEH